MSLSPEASNREVARLDVSVVAPMHNEEGNVAAFVERVDAALAMTGRRYEIIVVSDGSTDGTETILRECSKSHPSLRAVMLSRNVGQSAALDSGIRSSRGRAVVVMDGDLQNLPEDVPRLLDELDKGFDLVSGTRVGRSESRMLKLLPSRIANWMLRKVTGCPVRDMGGFKAIRGDLARSLRISRGQHRLLPAQVWLRGGSISEIPTQFPPRASGRSHYGIARSFDVFFDILLLWFQASAGSRPFHLLARAAMLLFAVDAVVMPWLLWDKFVNGVDMGTRPPFLVAIMFFLAGLFVLAAGFILEILAGVSESIRGNRGWQVREIVSSDPEDRPHA